MEGAIRSLTFFLCLISGAISEQDILLFIFFPSPLGHNKLQLKKHVVVVAAES